MEFGIFHSGHVLVSANEHERLLDEVTVAVADGTRDRFDQDAVHSTTRQREAQCS